MLMENVFPCCAGLDVHKESVEACVRRIEPNGRLHQETQHWGTMTRDLLLPIALRWATDCFLGFPPELPLI
jgi:hypothetical protein